MVSTKIIRFTVTKFRLYRAIYRFSRTFWHVFLIIPLAQLLYFWIGMYYPCYPPPHPSLTHIILCVFFLWGGIAFGASIGFYFPFQPYFILKFSKKKGKELADLLGTYSTQDIIILIAAVLFLLIYILLAEPVYAYMLYVSHYDEVGFFAIDLGYFTLFFIIYLGGGLMNSILSLYLLWKGHKGKPTWFDELKARIEMSEEKHEKDNLGVGER